MVIENMKNINDSLTGMQEIVDASGYSWQTVEKLIKYENFPAVKIGGRWSSDKDLIAEWRKEKIRKKQK